jgi:hypothetical protein
MLNLNSKVYQEIREYLCSVSVIETHEHYLGSTEPMDDVFDLIFDGYSNSDLLSATFRMEKEFNGMMNKKLSFEKRYDIFEKLYNRTNKTAYIKAIKTGLEACWGVKEINRNTLKELSEKLKKRDQNYKSQNS